MKFNTKMAKDIGMLAVFVLAVQIVLTKWIYPFFGSTTQQLYSITPATGVSSTVGTKIIGILSGIIPFSLGDIMSLIYMFIGAFVLLFAGYWVYEQRWAWKGKNIYQRLFAVLLYGSAALYVLLLVTNMGAVASIAMPLLIGVGVNYLAIALIVSYAARKFKFLRI